MADASLEPSPDCPLCPRLAEFRALNRSRLPGCFNAPVPSFGPADARLLIVGLAPGLKGANCSGRPFTGDFAGDLLYDTLTRYGFARGTYGARPDDGLELVDCRITNAVRCVPPENKPTGAEIKTCRTFLQATLDEMPRIEAIVTLGRIAHDSLLTALGLRRAAYPFGHAASYGIDGMRLHASYHCSRYNTQTRRLTPEMFRNVFAAVAAELDIRRSS